MIHSIQVTALGPGGESVRDDHTTMTLINQLVGMGLGECYHVDPDAMPTVYLISDAVKEYCYHQSCSPEPERLKPT